MAAAGDDPEPALRDRLNEQLAQGTRDGLIVLAPNSQGRYGDPAQTILVDLDANGSDGDKTATAIGMLDQKRQGVAAAHRGRQQDRREQAGCKKIHTQKSGAAETRACQSARPPHGGKAGDCGKISAQARPGPQGGGR